VQEVIKSLLAAGHSYEISDLYKMNFQTDMTESEYYREANYLSELPVSVDVAKEQEKINNCDCIVFISPVFWTEAPAKLVGWFDRVWTYGFAYGARTMKKLDKAYVICIAGRALSHLHEHGHLQSMQAVMLGDRIFDRAKNKEMIVLDSMTKFNDEVRRLNWDKHLRTVYELGQRIDLH
jgi:NAD(P)H dehydrogenase (quinone)